MKLLQRIMSRSLLIILVLVAGLAYYYRHELFPGLDKQAAVESTAAESQVQSSTSGAADNGKDGDGSKAVEEPTEAARKAPPQKPEKAAAAPQDTEAPQAGGQSAPASGQLQPPPMVQQRAGESRPSQPDGMEQGTDESAPAAEPQKPQAVGQQAAEQQDAPRLQPPQMRQESAEGSAPAPGTTAEQSTQAEGMDKEAAAAEKPDEAEQAVAAPQPETAPEPPAPATQTAAARQPTTHIDKARSAYWAGDIEAAIEEYRSAIEAQPENPDPAGELGNMLYARGDLEGAAEAYMTAAKRLDAHGETGRARHLARIVRSLDNEMGKELDKILNN